MTDLSFEAAGADRFRVTGRLAFDTVHGIWAASRTGLQGAGAPVVDLGAVTQVDSAGLALILEWVGWAQAGGKRLQLLNVPRKLLDLARISEVSDILDGVTQAG